MKLKKYRRAAAMVLASVMFTGTAVFLNGCGSIAQVLPQKEVALTRYDASFLQLFDTVTSITGYAKDKETFTAVAQDFHDRLEEYHQLYDIYNDYEGVNNIKTINDNAGIAPVKVDTKIIDLLDFAKEMGEKTNGRMNIAMGSVLSIWHEYRTEGIDHPDLAKLPPMEELKVAFELTDIEKVEVDREASTVYLPEANMSLDVGAVAKGYATEMVCEAMEADGLTDALISVGGNVRAIGTKNDGSKWKVGIQNPDLSSETKYLHTVDLEDMSLVSSGSYQRFYTVDGKTYHHIIDPDTLMPSTRYVSVTILCHDSGMADALSTTLFNMDQKEGAELIDSMENTEAMWIFTDGSEAYSSGFKNYMEN